MSPHHRRALALSMGLAALLYLGVVLFADREAVFAALWRISLPVLVAIFALSLLNYLLRFWRWQRYIAAFGHLLPWWRHFLYYLAGFTLRAPRKTGYELSKTGRGAEGVSLAMFGFCADPEGGFSAQSCCLRRFRTHHEHQKATTPHALRLHRRRRL